jgi:hypothetical protein
MGISLTGLTPATTYDALIKVGDNGPITSALKVLSDGLGTNLPMEASTTGVNFTGVAQVGGVGIANTTQVAAKQDTLISGTNIKTINSTSILGSGNISVVTAPSGVSGAIQFSNGSAFASDATNFFWDDTNNRLGVGTNAPSNTTEIQIPSTYAAIGSNANLYLTSALTSAAIKIGVSGSGAGCAIQATQSGGGTAFNLALNPFGGSVNIGNSNLGASLGIKGSGSTSATTSLLVQNSAGTEVMRMRDDGVTKFLGGAARIEATYIWMNSGQLDVPVIYNAGTMYLTPTGNVFGSASRIGSALLQVDSTTQGFLPPRMTTTQKNAIATPAAGLVVYDNTTNKLQCYNGSTWNDLF